MGPVESRQAIAAYQQEVGALAERAEEAKAKLKELTGTASSPDGAVTVTVNAAGALQNVVFGPRADEVPRAQLAAAVLATARRAQGQAARQVTGIMAPLVGENSEAMRFVREQVPVPDVPEEPPRPARHRAAGDDDDFDTVVGRDGW